MLRFLSLTYSLSLTLTFNYDNLLLTTLFFCCCCCCCRSFLIESNSLIPRSLALPHFPSFPSWHCTPYMVSLSQAHRILGITTTSASTSALTPQHNLLPTSTAIYNLLLFFSFGHLSPSSFIDVKARVVDIGT